MSALANALNAELSPEPDAEPSPEPSPAPGRAAINAANAQFSTGPKSDAGKDRVKFNAVKTGLFARTIVLPHEDQSAYEALGADLLSRWDPQSAAEHELIVTIQNLAWRLDRATALEFNLYALTTAQQIDSITEQFPALEESARLALAQAAGYLANARAFNQLNSQEGRLQRALDRANREMCELVSLRPLVPPTLSPDLPAAATPATPPTGFVPPKFPDNMPAFSGKKAKQHRRLWLIKNGHRNLA